MSNTNIAAPRCFIDVYPYEGGQFTVSGNSVAFLGVTTSKSITGGGNGTFTLTLAPGGPYGLNARPTWTEIFTPFSLVVIGMQRSFHAAVVMVGLVVSTEESMSRDSSGVQRVIQVTGEDFTRIFNTFSYYNLSVQTGITPPNIGLLGLPSVIAGALQGTPDTIGSVWYNRIMAGPDGLLASTSFAYRGSRVTFTELMATWFEPYPANIDIPTLAPFLVDEGSWTNKFLTFFPYPWYEFFIQTAPVNYYKTIIAQESALVGVAPNQQPTPLINAAATPVVMTNFPPVSPTLVARVNPLPFLTASGSSTTPTYHINTARFVHLPNYGIDSNKGSIGQKLGYSEVEVKNYYVFMPTWLLTAFGQSNGSITPFQLLFSSWIDQASIHRYGYRPNTAEVRWMADKGEYAQALAANGLGASDFNQLVADLSLRPVSYYEPTPNMLRGVVKTELRPDILPGNTFTFAPYRDGVPWAFYINAVTHTVPFNGMATTELSLSRGLTVSDYNNADLMVALHTGNAQRVNGSLAVGLPPGIGKPLLPLNLDTIPGIVFGLSGPFGSPRN